MTNFKKTTLAIVASGLLGGLGSVHAEDVPVFNFPDPSTFAVLYDDFYSFSMPILSSAATGFTSTQYGTNSLYYINTANTIQDALVIGTGSGGSQDNTDLNLTGFYQNAYDFPNVTGGGVAIFSTTTSASPPSFNDTSPTSSDSATTWDISLQALRDYLTIDGILYDMVAYFNNNQQKDDGADLFGDNNLWAYAEVTLVDSETGTTKTLYFRDISDQYYAIMDYANGGVVGDYVDPYGHGEYVLSGGTVTLCFNWNNGTDNTAGSTVTACSGSFDWSEKFEHNLGQNSVAYGLTSLELNDIIHDLGSAYDLMRVRVDFDQLNNGYENLYIGAACINCGFQVPEPNALSLAALGLLGLGLVARRRRQS